MSDNLTHAKEVYEWSSRQTAESLQFNEDNFYFTEPCKRALMRLENTQAILLGIVGLQGTGKSSTLMAIEKVLYKKSEDSQRCIRYKWSRDWKTKFYGQVGLQEEYYYALLDALQTEKPEKVIKFGLSADTLKHHLKQKQSLEYQMKRIKDEQKQEQLQLLYNNIMSELELSVDNEEIERMLGEKSVNNIKERFLDKFLTKVRYIIVDMPDYTKNDIRTLSKDVDELQHLWAELMRYNQKVSFVVAIQKEIAMKRPHFFFGKFSLVELKPLTPEQLVEAYRLKWTTCEPFNEASLLLIGKLCRGVFRRFLKYVNLTIEKALMDNKQFPIKSEDVQIAISFDTLLGDIELEFADIFTQQTHKVLAAKILELVRAEALTQKQIADKLNISESMITKLIGKLELYGYVKRVRGEGKAWLVSLA